MTVVWGGLLWLLAWALGWIWAAAAAGNAAAPLVLVFCLVLLVLPMGAACWMFPLLSRFTFRPVGLMLTALRLAVGCLPRTVGLVLIVGVSALLVRAAGAGLPPVSARGRRPRRSPGAPGV